MAAYLTPEDWHLITVGLQVLRTQVMQDMEDTDEGRQRAEEELAQIRTVTEKVAYVRALGRQQ